MKDIRSDSAADYLIAHSGYIYLMDQQGRTRALYRTSNKAEEMVEGIRKLLREEWIFINFHLERKCKFLFWVFWLSGVGIA